MIRSPDAHPQDEAICGRSGEPARPAGDGYWFEGTLLDRLRQASVEDDGARGITFIEGSEVETFLSYADLYREATVHASLLRSAGAFDRREVVLPIEDNRDFVILFWACLLADAVPVPVAGAAHEELNRKLLRILRVLKRPLLVATNERIRKLQEFVDAVPSTIQAAVIALDDLRRMQPAPAPPAEPKPKDLAFLQFSSGSTGNPKGVMLTHANLLANIGSTLRSSRATSEDSMLSWMPLSHDMGLIGVHLRCVCAAFHQYLMPTSLFIRRPMLWLDAVSKHGATHLIGPNFGFEYLLSAYSALGVDQAKPAWDLSCVRVISNGAEPISAAVAERFCTAMATHGMGHQVMQACYGLAENTLAVAMSGPDRPLAVWQVTRDSLAIGHAIRLARAEENALNLVDCGPVVDTAFVKIAAEDDRELPALHVGRILVRGASTSAGYYNDRDATAASIRDGWLDTGDLGFLNGQNLIVSGRAKEVLILNGANYYSHDLERVVGEALALESGNVVASGCYQGGSGPERLVIFIRHKGSAATFDGIAEQARRTVAAAFGLVPCAVVPIRKVPKTTSGKVQRYRLAEAWQNGEFSGIAKRSFSSPHTLQIVIEIAVRLSGLHQIDPDRALAEQGIDSLRAVELAQRLSEHTGLQLPPATVFDYPNLRALAAHADALLAKQTRALNPPETQHINASEPIAILGVGLRLPGGVSNLDEFWSVLTRGVDAVTEVPAGRWDPGLTKASFGAFLDNVEAFDARYFEISGGEAAELDPQQRLLLETTTEALESAAQNVFHWRGRPVGVFVGLSNTDYSRRHVNSGDLRRIGSYALTGSSPSAAAGRISYIFGFEGPALAVDTACSSSLVAVHLAAASLRSGESSLALAAGVNLMLGPELHAGLSQLGAMAPDGRSKAFDAAADGYARGEGCIVIVMKRLSEALALNDPILAVLRGSAINQDGASNGFTAPNGLAQRAVLRKALANAGVEAATVSYVEAHGTGTPLGDPQEITAIADVYGVDRNHGALLVGSVKTNIGHTEAAAGLAGLIKAVLCVRERAVPASLHLHNPSPAIPGVPSR